MNAGIEYQALDVQPTLSVMKIKTEYMQTTLFYISLKLRKKKQRKIMKKKKTTTTNEHQRH